MITSLFMLYVNFSLSAKSSCLHSFSVPIDSIEINIFHLRREVFALASVSKRLFGISRRRQNFMSLSYSSQRQPHKKSKVPRLPGSESRESLNDVTFVVSLPRRRAFARLNCKLRLHSPSICPLSPLASSHVFRSFKQKAILSLPFFLLSVPSLLKDLYSSSRRPDK